MQTATQLFSEFEVARVAEGHLRAKLSEASRQLDGAERRVIAFLKANRLTEARDGDSVYRVVEDASGPRVQVRDVPDVRHLSSPVIPPAAPPSSAEYGPEAYAKSDPDCPKCSGRGLILGLGPPVRPCSCTARNGRQATIDPVVGF
jgi:hypothetical protein